MGNIGHADMSNIAHFWLHFFSSLMAESRRDSQLFAGILDQADEFEIEARMILGLRNKRFEIRVFGCG